MASDRNAALKHAKQARKTLNLKRQLRRLMLLEQMEDRRVMAYASVSDIRNQLAHENIDGITVVTHGLQFFQSGGDSLMPLATAIRDRADAENGQSRGAWLLDYDVTGEGGQGAFDMDSGIVGSSFEFGSQIIGSASQVVLLFDWAAESNEPSAGWGEAAGDALFNLLVGLNLVDPQTSTSVAPLHFIGHSFGTAVTSEAVERLGGYSISVDQVTYLDPHDFDESALNYDPSYRDVRDIPIDEQQRLFTLGKPLGYGAVAWENVAFTDVYYQTLQTPDPEGRPIPGAYNKQLTYVELPLFELPHSAIWETWYTNTVTDVSNSATTGYAFSRVASGVDPRPSEVRPSQSDLANGNNIFSFYSPTQDHEHTPNAFRPTSILNAEQRSKIASSKQRVGFTGSTFYNGDFVFAGSTTMIPGWSQHGGGGTGYLVRANDIGLSEYVLELGPSGSYRTHNRSYIDESVGGISFDWRKSKSGSSTDLLAVEVNGIQVGSLNIATAALGQWNDQVFIPLPAYLRAQSASITFRLINSSNNTIAPTNTVQIDNVKLITGGFTGDVIPVDLSVLAEGSQFQLKSANLFTAGGTPINTTISLTQRGDWEIRSGNTVLGTIIFADRLEPGTIFSQTGKLVFAPGTSSAIADGVPAVGFQGRVDLVFATAESSSTQTLSLKIVDGQSGAGAVAVGDQLDVRNVSILQQRLNYQRAVSFASSSAFLQDPGQAASSTNTQIPALVIDGIVGPLTLDMVRRYKSTDNSTSLPLDSALDAFTLRRLNASGGMMDASEQQSLGRGLRAAADKLSFGAISQLRTPLPIVGTTPTETTTTPDVAKDEITLAESLSIDAHLRDSLLKPLADYLESTALPTLAGAQSFLANLGITGITLTNFVAALGTTGSQSVQNRFTIGFTRSVTDNTRSLYLGDDASREGLALGRTIPVTFTTTLTGSLDFGIDLSKPTLDEAFFVRVNSLNASASATLSPTSLINLPLLGRFLKLDVSSGSLSLAANTLRCNHLATSR